MMSPTESPTQEESPMPEESPTPEESEGDSALAQSDVKEILKARKRESDESPEEVDKDSINDAHKSNFVVNPSDHESFDVGSGDDGSGDHEEGSSGEEEDSLINRQASPIDKYPVGNDTSTFVSEACTQKDCIAGE